ncbi:MAG TPA: hypothetical protein VGM51_04510 [Armatimonadota bacterium]|jgi:hypothetical protein
MKPGPLRVAIAALVGLVSAGGAIAQDYRSETDGARPPREPAYRSPSRSYDDDPYGYTRVPTYRQGDDNAPLYDRGTRLVSGRITESTGAFGRTLKVLLDNGEERSVYAPRNVAVRRYGRPISVHELRRDELVRIRLERYSIEGDLTGLRIDVLEGAGRLDRAPAGRQVTVRGRVNSIDSRGSILRIDVDGRRVIVRVNRAEIRTSRGLIVLRDLENGDYVIVEGRRDGDDIFAASVTVR